jgi:hypothetical protein
MKNYQHFIASGCSFTACMPVNGPMDKLLTWENQSSVWPHFCFQPMDVANGKFLNFALPGGGNVAAMNNIIYYLESNKNINCSNTLVGFNLTGLYRRDTICRIDHPEANNDLSNYDIKENLNISWIHSASNGLDIKTPGPDEQKIYSCLSIVQAIRYIESKNIDYFFMLMNEPIYEHAPAWFKEFLDARTKNWVKFNTFIAMQEFVKSKNLTTDDGHPTRDGHRMIASYVLQHLENYDQT